MVCRLASTALLGALLACASSNPESLADASADSDAGDPTGDIDAGDPTSSNERNRAFLRYYAPIILKRGSESPTRLGRDWITNFDFDVDKDFSSNKDNWEDLQRFVTGEAHPAWQIRPTLYTAMIEFTLEGRTDAVLLYHVYHAKQQTSIHDWERVEIRINGISEQPGAGEEIRYALVTEHSKHNSRDGTDPDLNFMETSGGKHLLLWQAQETAGQLDKAELHFVEDSWATIKNREDENDTAEADVNGSDEKRFDYIFVPQADPEAVDFWSARKLTSATAMSLAMGRATRVPMSSTKRIQYELQDIADVFPTHWDGGFAARHWKDPSRRILITDELAPGIDDGPAVPTGLMTFFSGSIDDEDGGEERRGYASKHWLWGAYEIGGSHFYTAALAEGAPNGTRALANGDPDSLSGRYFHQHDYFAHEGTRVLQGPDSELGLWLPLGWHTEENGGFDGRWVQLFDNQPPE